MQRGTVVSDRFVVERLAGEGGMGSVYRATDSTTGAPVALKVLGPTADADRFAREIAMLAELRHPSIVRFVAHGEVSGRPFLAMEWLEGEDLAARLDRGPLSIRDAATIASRLAAAMGYAHARGVVHRDVKPSNVFLPSTDPTDARLVDFGIARDNGALSGLTRTGALIGTPGYMAPEQASGSRTLDARADVFALGCVLFECLTARPAFAGDNVMAVLAKILLDDAPRVSELRPDVPRALDDVVARLLSKDPSDRPADGLAVLRELENLTRDEPDDSHRPAVALGSAEQRFVTLVLVGVEHAREVATDATLAESDVLPTLERVRAVLAPLGARIAPLADGSVACVLTGRASASDQATRGARGALALRAARPDAPIAVASGRALLGGRLPLGEAIDVATRLLPRTRDNEPRAAVRVDELTAGLLGAEFVIGGDATSLLLLGERETTDAPKSLLGKPSPCVGRDKELSYVTGIFDECESEQLARAVMVTAPPGTGKSRLRQEIVARLGPRAEIWLARGDVLSAGSSLGMLSRLLRRAIGMFDGEPERVHVQKIRGRVGRNVREPDASRVAAFVGEIVGVPFPDGDHAALRAARTDPLLMGDGTRQAWIDFADAECSSRPLALVLEDVHWGDRASLEYVRVALQRLANRRLFVLALARPEVHQTFPALWADLELQEIKLSGLAPRAAERLVRSALGDGIDAATVKRLTERAGGNVFYLEELVRAQADGRAHELPVTIVAMAQSRLDDLEPEDRRVLRGASIVGEVFWRGALAALLGVPADASLDARLDALVKRELLSRQSGARFVGEEELAFRHALVREAAYASLTEDDRALGHRIAAQWLEQAGERDATTLAQHFDRGKVPARAAEWFLRAAEQALESNDFDSALARVERGIACGAQGETLGALRLASCIVRDWRGENADAARDGREAMTLLRRGTPSWYRAATTVAVACRRTGQRDGLSAVGRELLDLGVSRSPGGIELSSTARVALQLAVTAVPDLSRALLDLVAPFEDDVRTREPVAWAWIRAAAGMYTAFAGDPTPLLLDAAAMIDAAERGGDLRTACNVRFYVGAIAATAGDLATSEARFRAAIEQSRSLGLWAIEMIASKELAAALVAARRPAEALPLALDAARAAREQGDAFQMGTALETAAAAYVDLGDVDSAEPLAREAASRMDASPAFGARIRATLARVLLAKGRAEEALEITDGASGAPVAAAVQGSWGLALVRAEALIACGRVDEARDVARTAHQQILAASERIGDRRWVDSFLSLRTHARIAEIARAGA